MQISIGISVKGTKTSSPPSAPVNTVAPVASGNTYVGDVLTTTNGTWTGSPTFTYQWYNVSTGDPIVGATSTTYTLVAADANREINCQVTGTNAAGSSIGNSNTITTTALFEPFNAILPAIDAVPLYVVGDTLVIEVGSNIWEGNPVPVLTYQWLRNGNNITGATSATYLTVTADLAQTISVRCAATNSQGTAEEDSNNVIIF